jgi:c-di-GMP-related signal transduction protein
MDKLVPELPLQPAACAALCGEINRERTALNWLEAHEYGNWERAEEISREHELTGRKLIEHYMTAAGWADEVFAAAS